MLRAIILDRFKAFGENTRIELAPITLIYGENSAGKSSILQALSLLKQTLESPTGEGGAALLPRVENGLVDLGSFRELLFDHDISHPLRIGLGIEASKSGRRTPFRPYWMPEAGQFEMSFTFGQDKPTADVRLKQLSLVFQDRQYPPLEYETRQLEEDEAASFDDWLRPSGPRTTSMRLPHVAECTSISQDASDWRHLYESWHTARVEVARSLRRSASTLRRRPMGDEVSPDERDYPKAVGRAIDFYDGDFTIQEFIRRLSQASHKQASFLQGYLPLPMFRGGIPEEEVALRRSPASKRPPLPSLSFKDVLAGAGRLIANELAVLFPLGPFRRPPERWYMFTGTSPVDVGYQGNHLPDLLLKQSHLTQHANDWLKRLDIGYRLRVQKIGGRQSDLFALRLVDTRRERPVDVGLSDVGFGISQILPLVVQCLASNQRTISIEQPEVHLHPRLQADLGDLLAATVREPYGHQFLIETHSEHLLLRMQKLIRSGSLRAEDVSVIYVSRGVKGSTARRLHLENSGDFIDDWPGGFFPERMRELR